jgi:hypothetical protein
MSLHFRWEAGRFSRFFKKQAIKKHCVRMHLVQQKERGWQEELHVAGGGSGALQGVWCVRDHRLAGGFKWEGGHLQAGRYVLVWMAAVQRISSSLSRKRGAHSMAMETDASREEDGAGFESGLLDWLVLRVFGVVQTHKTFLVPSPSMDSGFILRTKGFWEALQLLEFFMISIDAEQQLLPEHAMSEDYPLTVWYFHSKLRRTRKDRRIQETGYPRQLRHCGMILMRFSDARVSFLHEWLCEGSLPSFKPGRPQMSGERVVNQIDSLPIFSFAECRKNVWDASMRETYTPASAGLLRVIGGVNVTFVNVEWRRLHHGDWDENGMKG